MDANEHDRLSTIIHTLKGQRHHCCNTCQYIMVFTNEDKPCPKMNIEGLINVILF